MYQLSGDKVAEGSGRFGGGGIKFAGFDEAEHEITAKGSFLWRCRI